MRKNDGKKIQISCSSRLFIFANEKLCILYGIRAIICSVFRGFFLFLLPYDGGRVHNVFRCIYHLCVYVARLEIAYNNATAIIIIIIISVKTMVAAAISSVRCQTVKQWTLYGISTRWYSAPSSHTKRAIPSFARFQWFMCLKRIRKAFHVSLYISAFAFYFSFLSFCFLLQRCIVSECISASSHYCVLLLWPQCKKKKSQFHM